MCIRDRPNTSCSASSPSLRQNDSTQSVDSGVEARIENNETSRKEIDLLKQIEELKVNISQKVSTINTLEAKLKSSEDEKSQLKNEWNTKSDQLKNNNKTLEDLTKKYASNLKEYNDFQSNTSNQMANLDKTIKDLEMNFKTETDALNEDLQTKARIILNLNSKIKTKTLPSQNPEEKRKEKDSDRPEQV